MMDYDRGGQPGVSRVMVLLWLGAGVRVTWAADGVVAGVERELSARESASSSIPHEPASVRVSCGGTWLLSSRGDGSQRDLQTWRIGRYGVSDAFNPVAVNGDGGHSSSRWPDSASGMARLRLAAVNGL